MTGAGVRFHAESACGIISVMLFGGLYTKPRDSRTE